MIFLQILVIVQLNILWKVHAPCPEVGLSHCSSLQRIISEHMVHQVCLDWAGCGVS